MRRNEILTPRQKEILSLSSHGKTYEEVAHTLGISEETVRSHLMTIRIKFNVKNTMGAVSIALSQGILSSQ